MSTTYTKKENFASIKVLVSFLILVLIAGAISAAMTLSKGHEVFGTTDQVGWNILIAAYVFLALTASGLCLTANFFEVLGIERFQLLQKRAHFLAISFLVPALGVLVMDLGRVDRMYYFMTSPNFSSPMWWMGTVYGIYLILLLFEFNAIHRGNQKAARAASIITLVGALTATSMLGGIFSVILDRTLWFGSGTPVLFVFSAVISGIAAMISVTILTYKLKGKELEDNLRQALGELGKILAVLLVISLVFTVWRLVSSYYVGVADTFYIISDPYGLQFWGIFIGVGIITPFILLLSSSGNKEKIMAIAGILVMIGVYVNKHIFVIGGQLRQPFGEPTGAYTSTMIEWSLIGGAIAAAFLIYMVGEKYLSLHATVEEAHLKDIQRHTFGQ